MHALQVSMLFAEWYRICELPGANDTASTHFIVQLHQSGLLKGDDMPDRFFRLLMVAFLSLCNLPFHTFGQDFQFDQCSSVSFFQEIAVAHCLSTEGINSGALQSPQQMPTMSFLAIDIYAKLVFSILKVVNCTLLFLSLIWSSYLISSFVCFWDRDQANFSPRYGMY